MPKLIIFLQLKDKVTLVQKAELSSISRKYFIIFLETGSFAKQKPFLLSYDFFHYYTDVAFKIKF